LLATDFIFNNKSYCDWRVQDLAKNEHGVRFGGVWIWNEICWRVNIWSNIWRRVITEWDFEKNEFGVRFGREWIAYTEWDFGGEWIRSEKPHISLYTRRICMRALHSGRPYIYIYIYIKALRRSNKSALLYLISCSYQTDGRQNWEYMKEDVEDCICAELFLGIWNWGVYTNLRGCKHARSVNIH